MSVDNKRDALEGIPYFKINYEINMHLIDFKIAHINVQALDYLILFKKITLGCMIVEI